MRALTMILPALLFLSACAPARLQSAQLIGEEQGRSRYHMTGYTDHGETAPNSSLRHVEYALSDVCPAGINIVSLTEAPSGNVSGKFLYWEAMVECK